MNDKLAYLFITIAAFINLAILLNSDEYKRCNCNQNGDTKLIIVTLFLFYLHYFIHCFGLYGFLFDNKWILGLYLIVPIIIVTGWSIGKSSFFKSACGLTNVTDRLCKMGTHDTMNFDEIYRQMCIPDISIKGYKSNLAYFLLTIFGYAFAIYKLFKN